MSVAYLTEDDGSQVTEISRPGLRALVTSQAMCARSGVDTEQRYPVSVTAPAARLRRRRQSPFAPYAWPGCIALIMSLRYWTVGQHGVWGGTVPAERAELRRRRVDREESC